MHANNKAMDFDLDLAKEKSQKNPVFMSNMLMLGFVIY